MLLLLALPWEEGVGHSESKLLMVHIPTSRAAAAAACSGSTEDGSIWNGTGEQGHPFLSHHCSGTAAVRQSRASIPGLPEYAHLPPPVDVSLELADCTRGATPDGAIVSHDGALWRMGHCRNNSFPFYFTSATTQGSSPGPCCSHPARTGMNWCVLGQW